MKKTNSADVIYKRNIFGFKVKYVRKVIETYTSPNGDVYEISDYVKAKDVEDTNSD